MSEVNIEKYLDDVLGTQNTARLEAETNIKVLTTEQPNDFFKTIFRLLRDSTQSQKRQMSSILIRNTFMKNAAEWERLSVQNREDFCNQIFTVLENESQKHIKQSIAVMIGRLYRVAPWRDCMPTLFEMISSDQDHKVLSALKILSEIFESGDYSQHKTKFHELFTKTLTSPNHKIQKATIATLALFCNNHDEQHVKIFKDLSGPIFEAFKNIISKQPDSAKNTCINIQDLVESVPKFSLKEKEILQLSRSIIEEHAEDSNDLKQELLVLLVVLLERHPKKYQTSIDEIFNLLFTAMISFEEEPEETWECPPEGYDDLEDGDCDYLISNSRNLFNRILEAVAQSISIPSLRTQVDQHILREDWKSKHVGLTALSQVGDDMSAEELASVIGLVLPLLKHEHVKVRYATLHLIGQISDDAKPDFQARHHLTVLPALMECFEESCPRVLSHVFAALTNFLEGATPEQTEPYVKALVEVCVKNLENGISIVKEAALSTLAALAQGARSTFEPYFDNLYNLVYEILLNSTGNQYRQLRGQAIETLTLFALGVGPKTFMSYLPDLVITIIDIQDNAVDYIGADPQISYVFTGWNRLATIFGKNLTFALEQFMPGFMKLFQAVLKSFEVYLQATKGKKNADADPNNLYDEEDMCSALESVNALASELCSDFIAFVPKLEPLVIKCLNTSYYDASAPALKCLPSFFKALQVKYFSSNDKVQAKEKFNQYIKLILKLCYHEGELDMYPDLARSLKSMVEAGGTLCDETELADLIRKTLKMIDDSILMVKKLIKENEVENEDDAESQINEEIALQEESQEHLVELLGVFFEINKDLSSTIMKEHSATSLPRYFDENDEMHSPYIGLYIIYFMLLTLKYDSLSDIFDFMCDHITKYLADTDNLVRQCAGSALAAVSKRGHEQFQKYATGFLAGIKEGLAIPDDNSGSDWILAKDNMTAALGNLIWYQTSCLTGLGELSDLWLTNLPIREDKPDGLEQHELLLDRLINPFAELILGKTGGNVLRVMEIFGTILGTEMCNEDIEKKIHIVINLMKLNGVMFEALKQSLLVLPIDMVEKVKKFVLS